MIEHVFVIPLENFDLKTALEQPYLKELYDTYGVATKYFGVSYPSLPNYLALAGGSNQNVHSDGCNPGIYDVLNLGDLIETAQKTWIAYAESAPSNCPSGDSGDYICHHFPWIYYSDVWNDKQRCEEHCVAIEGLVDHYPYLDTPPNFVFITPNMVNDGHTPPSPKNANDFCAAFIPKLMAQTWFKNSIIFLTVDTGNPSTNGYKASDGTVINGGQVLLVAISNLSKGKIYTGNACHYNLVSSIIEILGLKGPLGKAGTLAFPPMSSLYNSTVLPQLMVEYNGIFGGGSPHTWYDLNIGITKDTIGGYVAYLTSFQTDENGNGNKPFRIPSVVKPGKYYVRAQNNVTSLIEAWWPITVS